MVRWAKGKATTPSPASSPIVNVDLLGMIAMLTVFLLLLIVASAVCAGLICFACALSGQIEDCEVAVPSDSRSGLITIDARLSGDSVSN